MGFPFRSVPLLCFACDSMAGEHSAYSLFRSEGSVHPVGQRLLFFVLRGRYAASNLCESITPRWRLPFGSPPVTVLWFFGVLSPGVFDGRFLTPKVRYKMCKGRRWTEDRREPHS
uniref:Putative secreted protein n=1 Tax=Anopheles darlingi TaxID=43151 RepID=A0A2M4DFW9_ANODA